VFITLEGPEGAGKTTMARRLYEALRGRVPVRLAREPGGTPIGEAIRRLLLDEAHRGMRPETEALLFAASRAQYVAEVVRPALAGGVCMLSERYVDASLAYQGYGRGLPLAVIRQVNELATGGLLPDLTLLLDIDPAVGLARARNAGGKEGAPGRGDRLEQEALAFHERVREGFLRLAREEPARFVVIDGAGAPDAVFAAVLAAVARVLATRGWVLEGPKPPAGGSRPGGG
jgi:dTMP kinase